MNRATKVSLILVAILVSLTIGGVVYAQAPVEGGVTLTVDGVETPVRKGAVVHRGAAPSVPPDTPADTPLSCTFPALDLKVSGSSGVSGVTLTLGEDCSITVSEITRSGDEQAYDSAEIRYKGWAKSELNDPYGIDLASIRARIEYTDFGDYLAGASGDFAHCDAYRYQHGWRVVNCQWTKSVSPSLVVVQGVGNFTHITWPQMAHWQEATFKGTPGGYDYWCRFPQIDVPDHLPELHFKCTGDRTRLPE